MILADPSQTNVDPSSPHSDWVLWYIIRLGHTRITATSYLPARHPQSKMYPLIDQWGKWLIAQEGKGVRDEGPGRRKVRR